MNYPRKIESYQGIEIWFDSVKGKYYASHCEHTKRSQNIQELKDWIKRYKF